MIIKICNKSVDHHDHKYFNKYVEYDDRKKL